jgi:hypothetical protein
VDDKPKDKKKTDEVDEPKKNLAVREFLILFFALTVATILGTMWDTTINNIISGVFHVKMTEMWPSIITTVLITAIFFGIILLIDHFGTTNTCIKSYVLGK